MLRQCVLMPASAGKKAGVKIESLGTFDLSPIEDESSTKALLARFPLFSRGKCHAIVHQDVGESFILHAMPLGCTQSSLAGVNGGRDFTLVEVEDAESF